MTWIANKVTSHGYFRAFLKTDLNSPVLLLLRGCAVTVLLSSIPKKQKQLLVLKIDFFTGTEPIWKEPPKQVECRVPPRVAPSSPVSIQLLSIDNLIAAEFLGQTIDNHEREELFNKR